MSDSLVILESCTTTFADILTPEQNTVVVVVIWETSRSMHAGGEEA
jgi:hypothetical protein